MTAPGSDVEPYEVLDAELVDLTAPARPEIRLLVDQHTVLRPGQALPTTSDGPRYTKRDLDISEETARALDAADGQESGPMRAFRAWCGREQRVPVPCTTATYTEYGRHLMSRGLKVTTISNYMSLIRTTMPVGKQPDNSLFLKLLKEYRQTNKRAVRRKQAFPITLPYLIPMMEKAEATGRPLGWRDAAMLAFGYRFLARRSEEVDLDIEDLVVMDDRIVVWLLKDKTHQTEDQTLTLHDRPDLRMVPRMRRWLAHLAAQGITTGPLFRHLLKNGTVASSETRAKKASKRGDYLRGHTVNERVKHWFAAAELSTDGRPVSAQGLRAGGATDLGESDATEEELEEAGRWAKGSPIPRKVYVRPAQKARHDPFAKVPMYGHKTWPRQGDAAVPQETGTLLYTFISDRLDEQMRQAYVTGADGPAAVRAYADELREIMRLHQRFTEATYAQDEAAAAEYRQQLADRAAEWEDHQEYPLKTAA